MERIKTKFKKMSKEYPALSSLILFNQCINKSRLSQKDVTDLFDTLVSREDYEPEDYDDILTYSIELSKSGR